MTPEEHNKSILARYLPPSAVEPVFAFLNGHSVHFHITRSRTSKLGDYRMPQPRHQYHEISVNGDLGPRFFLLVLLHEMAHLNTFLQYGRAVQAHGHEWQEQYRRLLVRYQAGGCFAAGDEAGNAALQRLVAAYTAVIPLNRAAGAALERKLKELDAPADAPRPTLLKDLPVGTLFRIGRMPGRLFRCEEKRRTRYKCLDVAERRYYLVSGDAEVEPEEKNTPIQ